MSTLRQIEANRRNAKKSTGPNGRAGKAVSSKDAPKTGMHAPAEVLPCESRAGHDALIARYYRHFRPTKPEECCYVDELIFCEWTLRRLRRANTELYRFVHQECRNTNEDYPAGQACAEDPEVFSALQRRFNGTRRALRNAGDALRDLRTKPIPGRAPETRRPDPAANSHATLAFARDEQIRG